MYVIVCYMYNDSEDFKDWKRFARRNYDGGDLYSELGIALINNAIKLEWTDTVQ